MEPETSEIPEMLTAEEVAERLKVSRQTVHGWIKEGALKAVRLGPEPTRTIRVTREEFQRFAAGV